MSPAYLYGVDTQREHKALEPARVQCAVLREPLRRGGVADASGCGEVKHFAVITRSKAETGLLLSRLSTNVWLRAAELAFRAVARRRAGERRGPDVSRFYATLRAAVRVGTIHG